MGKKQSQPQAPDPMATAAAQGVINKETAIAQTRLNQVDEYTPYGNSIFTPTGEVEDGIQRFRRDTTLNPEQQAIVDQQTAISGNLNTLAGDQLGRVQSNLADPYGYDDLPGAPVADAAARQEAIDAMYGQYESRLNPQFDQQQTALETRLANQGIGVGSDAYNQAMESFGRTRNDAYQSAQNQAVGAGGAEQSRLFGLQGNARERAIQEYERQRNAPLNETNALMSGTQIQNPTFSPTPQTSIANTDYTGLVNQQYAGQMNAYNQGQSRNNAAMGGLFGLAGSIGGGLAGGPFGAAAGKAIFSDIRVKQNISKVGTLDNGLPVYSFQYIDGGPQQIGLMAQDVEHVHPNAVSENAQGIKMVDYSEAVL